jgi:hypothetical protein
MRAFSISIRGVLQALCALTIGGALAGCGSGMGGASPGSGTGGNGASSPDLATATAPPDLAQSPSPPDLAMPPAPPDLAIVSDATKFLGTWIYGTGATATTDCPGQTPSTDLSTSTFMVTFKSSNTITLSAGAALACNLDFTVAGSTATIVPGQSCTVTEMGTTATVSPNSGGTFVTSDGTTAQITAGATVKASIIQCNASISASSAHR